MKLRVLPHESSSQTWRGTRSGKVRRFLVRDRDRLILDLLDRYPGRPCRLVAKLAEVSANQVMRVVRPEGSESWQDIRQCVRSPGDRQLVAVTEEAAPLATSPPGCRPGKVG